MAVFTFKPLGANAVAELHEALRRYVRVYRAFSGESFLDSTEAGYDRRSQRQRSLTRGSAEEIDEIVSAGERDSPYWDVRVRKESHLGVDVGVEELVTYKLRPGHGKGVGFGVQLVEWLGKVRRLPSEIHKR